MPPCPGSSRPLSLTPAMRLSRLSVRSPTTEISAVTKFAASAIERQTGFVANDEDDRVRLLDGGLRLRAHHGGDALFLAR